MIQIRNVPYGLHRRLKARAAMEGRSMSQFVLRENLSAYVALAEVRSTTLLTADGRLASAASSR